MFLKFQLTLSENFSKRCFDKLMYVLNFMGCTNCTNIKPLLTLQYLQYQSESLKMATCGSPLSSIHPRNIPGVLNGIQISPSAVTPINPAEQNFSSSLTSFPQASSRLFPPSSTRSAALRQAESRMKLSPSPVAEIANPEFAKNPAPAMEESLTLPGSFPVRPPVELPPAVTKRRKVGRKPFQG